jgi:predicted transcriptional regulator
LTKNQTTNDQIKEYILQTVKKRKPQTAKELVTLIQQTQNLPEKQITDLLTQLENEDKLRFTKQEPPTPASARAYIISQKARNI